MADKSTLEQMLEHLVNDDTKKAEELFHEYVVTKSREIYENLIEEEMEDEDVKEDSKDEEVDEASKDDNAEEDKVDEATDEEVDESTDEDEVKEDSKDEAVEEEFEEVAIEADDEADAMGGDETDDLEAEIDADAEGDEGDKDPEELFQDLDSIVDELQAKFDDMKGGEEDAGDEMGDEMDDEMKDSIEEPTIAPEVDELATMREYVEKVAGGAGKETGADAKSPVAGKNDMGGSAANIAKGEEAKETPKADKPKEDNAGNVNVPGGKAADSLKKQGGEAASSESGADTQSLFRGRR